MSKTAVGHSRASFAMGSEDSFTVGKAAVLWTYHMGKAAVPRTFAEGYSGCTEDSHERKCSCTKEFPRGKQVY
jgi:hypothetical protein